MQFYQYCDMEEHHGAISLSSFCSYELRVAGKALFSLHRPEPDLVRSTLILDSFIFCQASSYYLVAGMLLGCRRSTARSNDDVNPTVAYILMLLGSSLAKMPGDPRSNVPGTMIPKYYPNVQVSFSFIC